MWLFNSHNSNNNNQVKSVWNIHPNQFWQNVTKNMVFWHFFDSFLAFLSKNWFGWKFQTDFGWFDSCGMCCDIFASSWYFVVKTKRFCVSLLKLFFLCIFRLFLPSWIRLQCFLMFIIICHKINWWNVFLTYYLFVVLFVIA